MIENPNEWFYNSAKYAIDNKNQIQYGCVFLLRKDAPDKVQEDYKKYIKLIKKSFFSLGIGVFKPYNCNGLVGYKLIGFNDNLNDFEKEQADIMKKLIDNGCISNEPFI